MDKATNIKAPTIAEAFDHAVADISFQRGGGHYVLDNGRGDVWDVSFGPVILNLYGPKKADG